MHERRSTSNPFAGSICRHSTLHRTINIMMASTKPRCGEDKNFFTLRGKFPVQHRDRKESFLIRARTYLTEASSLREESGKKMESRHNSKYW